MIYGTSAQFLQFFGLKSLRDLPTLREFTELSVESEAALAAGLAEDDVAEKAPGEEENKR